MRAGVRVRGLALAAGAVLLASAAACGDDDDDGGPIQGDVTTPENPDTTTIQGAESPPTPLKDVPLKLTSIGEFDAPIAIVPRVNDTALYVAGFNGTVTKVRVDGEGAARTYTPAVNTLLDIDSDVITEGERGFLDIAFSPDGNTLYVSYSSEPDGVSKIESFAFNGEVADMATRKTILEVDDFAANHNGGDITFGPDGYLYIAMGDGGGGGDPEKTAQDLESMLGKILRIDPEGAADGQPYAIPPDNPFADGSGGLPEIWLYGVRNPWRFSFDALTKDLWIGDVGQGAWEEVDWLPAADGGGKGANLGWSEMEGSHEFEGGENPEGGVLPVYEYELHEDGTCAVTGGYVYRGGTTAMALEGAYIYGDSCQSQVRALRIDSNGTVIDEFRYEDTMAEQLVSFGVDNGGDLYAVALGGGEIYRLDA